VELADTSAWTTRRRSADVEAEFSLAVRKGRIATCRPVRHELLITARTANEIAAMRADLDNLVQIVVGEQEWRRSEEVLEELGRRGPLHHR
jgi:predicted nucleic acid-binding protein